MYKKTDKTNNMSPTGFTTANGWGSCKKKLNSAIRETYDFQNERFKDKGKLF